MAASERVSQIAAHLVPSFQRGMFEGQTVIVTGSGQGIGYETAKLFAREGANVVVSDLDGEKCTKVAAELKGGGGKVIGVQGDVTDRAFPERLIKETVDAFGGINVIVNNAGFTYDGVIHKMSDKQYDIMLDVHAGAPFRIVRAAAPYLRKALPENGNAPPNKCIINISSTSGVHGNAGQVNYSVAKAGVTGLTKTICKEWGRFGVRANTVTFGYITTRLTSAKGAEGSFVVLPNGEKVALGIPGAAKPGEKGKDSAGGNEVARVADIPLGRPGTAAEAAQSILLIASPWASYINGQTIEVTGGRNI